MRIPSKNLSIDDSVYNHAFSFVNRVEEGLQEIIVRRTNGVVPRLQKVLKVFSDEGLGMHHFQSVDGLSLIHI